MIASTGNARVRAVTALAKKAKARREQGVFLVEGPKMFGELPVERRREVYVSENFLEVCHDTVLNAKNLHVLTANVNYGMNLREKEISALCMT